MKTCLKHFLLELGWVRLSSCVVLLVSLVLASWFIANREIETSSQQKGEAEGTEKEDYPHLLTRLEPVEVGYVRELYLVPGKVHKMKTLSLRPALFEIEHFLTEQECNDIIFMAQTQGLERSKTLGEQSLDENGDGNDNSSNPELSPAEIFQGLDSDNDGSLDVGEVARGVLDLGRVIVNVDDVKKMISDLDMDPNKDGIISYEEFEDLTKKNKEKELRAYLEKIHETNSNKRTRDSSTTFLDPYEHLDFKPFFESLRDRIHLATNLPKDMIWSSENMQVVRYQEKQHYHCHFDSEEEVVMNTPCCHYTENLYEDDNLDCVPCRYLTLFYYLNEPKLGGETAFPAADNFTLAENESNVDRELLMCDLADHCYDSNLYYKPKRGTALLWYNHFVDNETGWLGPMDFMSYHGGCNVIEGTKWAANNWINAGPTRELDVKLWEETRLMEEDFQERMKREPWEEQTGQKSSDEQSNYNEEKPLEKQNGLE